MDSIKSKRALVLGGVLRVVAAALLFAFHPAFTAVMVGQALLGGVGAVFAPSLNAISLGLVGFKALDAPVGRNQSFNSAGNFVAVIVGRLMRFP